MKLIDIDCGTCTNCCTSKVHNRFMTPVFEVDTLVLNHIKPEYRLEDGTSTCIHLSDRGCNQYDKRPKICRWYPLYPLLIRGRVVIGLATVCGVSEAIKDVYSNRDPELISDLHTKLEEMTTSLSEEELHEYTEGILASCEVITILNLEAIN